MRHALTIEVPCSLKEALQLNCKNSNTSYWADAVSKEMGDIHVAVEILGPTMKPPLGWAKLSGRLIFDVKMDFSWKAHWVKNGHKIPDIITPSFAGNV